MSLCAWFCVRAGRLFHKSLGLVFLGSSQYRPPLLHLSNNLTEECARPGEGGWKFWWCLLIPAYLWEEGAGALLQRKKSCTSALWCFFSFWITEIIPELRRMGSSDPFGVKSRGFICRSSFGACSPGSVRLMVEPFAENIIGAKGGRVRNITTSLWTT